MDDIFTEKFKKMIDLKQKAMKFAIDKHDGQKDDSGKDYFEEHLFPVLMAVTALKPDDYELQIAAMLHDTLEDTRTKYKELKKEFGKRVADLVNEVTHRGRADKKGYYFPKLKSADAILIKLIDRASNVGRMDSWSESRKKHYLKLSKFWRDK